MKCTEIHMKGKNGGLVMMLVCFEFTCLLREQINTKLFILMMKHFYPGGRFLSPSTGQEDSLNVYEHM